MSFTDDHQHCLSRRVYVSTTPSLLILQKHLPTIRLPVHGDTTHSYVKIYVFTLLILPSLSSCFAHASLSQHPSIRVHLPLTALHTSTNNAYPLSALTEKLTLRCTIMLHVACNKNGSLDARYISLLEDLVPCVRSCAERMMEFILIRVSAWAIVGCVAGDVLMMYSTDA